MKQEQKSNPNFSLEKIASRMLAVLCRESNPNFSLEKIASRMLAVLCRESNPSFQLGEDRKQDACGTMIAQIYWIDCFCKRVILL